MPKMEAYACTGEHKGACAFGLTTALARLLTATVEQRSALTGGEGSEDARLLPHGELKLQRLPGVYLLGDYYVGSSVDIGQRRHWHLNALNSPPVNTYASAHRGYRRRHKTYPRLTVLSVNELDEQYCITRLLEAKFPLINLDVRPEAKPACLCDEPFGRALRLNQHLSEVNDCQSAPTNRL